MTLVRSQSLSQDAADLYDAATAFSASTSPGTGPGNAGLLDSYPAAARRAAITILRQLADRAQRSQ